MTKTKPCLVCGGSRHLRDESGAWVVCGCLARERSLERYRRAGIPVRHDTETWATFSTAWRVAPSRIVREVAATLRKDASLDPPWLLLSGRTLGRELLSSLLLRSACDSGASAAWVDLPRLIDAEFKRDDDVGESTGEIPTRAVYRVGALAVSLGGEPRHRWNRNTLEKVLRVRWAAGLWTLLVVSGDPSRIGATYESVAIDEAISERFSRVDVSTRAG